MSQERLEASLDIDRLPAVDVVRVIQEEDGRVAAAVAAERDKIAHAVDEIAERLAHGGRLFYAGAGTSGRIAALDAAELPPTFGIDPSLVQVLMAGGERAFLHAVEGAEDDEEAAIAAVNEHVRADDAVVGIAASGTTPYTVAAVRRANMLGALTVGITSVAVSPLAREVDIAATNEKLRNRAVRIVELAAGVLRPTAVQAIRDADGNVKLAAVIAKKRISAAEARALLEAHGGRLREVLEA